MDPFIGFLLEYKLYFLLAFVVGCVVAILLRRSIVNANRPLEMTTNPRRKTVSEILILMQEHEEIGFLVKNLTATNFPYFIVFKNQQWVEVYFFESSKSAAKYDIYFDDFVTFVQQERIPGMFPLLRRLVIDTGRPYVLEPFNCIEILSKQIDPSHIV